MENLFKMYEVGGKVRDEILGLESKDVDYVAVPNNKLLQDFDTVESMFSMLEQYLRDEKFVIFQITADCFTIRAKFPKDHKYSGVADFVMARRELGYIPGTRTPIVKPGTLYDDLERRDTTLNALAKDEDGTIIDYFNGLTHLKYGILRTPLDPIKTFDDVLKRFDKKFFKKHNYAEILGQYLNEGDINDIEQNILTLEEWFSKRKETTFAL